MSVSLPVSIYMSRSTFVDSSFVFSVLIGKYRECSRLMVNFHRNSGTGKLTGVHRKYSTSKFGYAVKNEPANFLLEAKF